MFWIVLQDHVQQVFIALQEDVIAFHALREHTSQTLARHLNRPVNHVLSLPTHQRIQVVYNQMYMKLTVQVDPSITSKGTAWICKSKYKSILPYLLLWICFKKRSATWFFNHSDKENETVTTACALVFSFGLWTLMVSCDWIS